MKINKLRINGYGKFSDKEITLGKGLTIIFGRNEAGKSTIQSFIKAMLFDFPRKNVDKEGRLPEQKKYKPWTGPVFGGMIEIDMDDGSKLKIDRDFARRNSSVFDGNLKDITSEFPYSKKDGLSVGETLLNMDRECFENTAFIRQGGTIVLQDDRKNLFEKLMNLSHTGSENTSVAVAKTALSKAATSLGNNRTKGRPYNTAMAEFLRLKSLKESADQKRVEMAEYNEKQLSLEKEINMLKNKAAKYKSTQDAIELIKQKSILLEKKRNYDGYSEQIKNLSNEIYENSSKIEKFRLPDNITEKELLDNVRITASAIERQKNISGEDPEASLAKLLSRKQRKRLWLALCYSGVTISAILAIIFHPAVFILTALITLVLIYLHLKKPLHSESDLLDQIKLVNDSTNELILVNSFIESAGFKKAATFEEADGILKKLIENKNKFTALEGNIKRQKERKADLESFRNSIPGQYGDIKEIERTLMDITGRLSGFDLAEDSTVQTSVDPQSELNIKQSELSGVKAVLREYLQSDEEIAQIEESMQLYQDKLDSIQMDLQALELASDLIGQAAESLQQDIIPLLNEKTGEILDRITTGRHSVLATGLNNEMNTEYMNSVHSLWEFSDGTIDQMYFALRIASADVFSEKESVPIIIDEAFAYYDEDRIKSTFDLLNEIARDKQILVFTCKEKELEMVLGYENIGIIHL